jgi:hypothetical protein
MTLRRMWFIRITLDRIKVGQMSFVTMTNSRTILSKMTHSIEILNRMPFSKMMPTRWSLVE